MRSSSRAANETRNRSRDAVHLSHPPSHLLLPTPTLRAAVACAVSASPSAQLGTPIQSRPLQANPAHPLLWNSSTTSGSAALQHHQQQQQQRPPSAASTASTPSSPARGGGFVEQRRGSRCGAPTPSPAASSVQLPPQGRPASPGVTSGTTAHVVVQPHRPSDQRFPSPAHTHNNGGSMSVAPSAAAAGRLEHGRRVAAVNYNALLQQEQYRGEPVAVPLSPSPPPLHTPEHGMKNDADAAASLRLQRIHNGESSTTASPTDCLERGATSPRVRDFGASGGTVPSYPTYGSVEGPLPPEVRRIIAQSCVDANGAPDAAAMDAAEQQARRLISTGRRVKVYREELAAAEEERRDWVAAAEQRTLVRSALQTEVDDLNARIQALLQERALCEAQLRVEDDSAAREARKLAEAEERVTVLRGTIDSIVEETTVPRLILQQQVPSLLIENYI